MPLEPIRILFVGELHSSHAKGWIDLLAPQRERFRVEGVQLGPAPQPNAPYPVRQFPPVLRKALGLLPPSLPPAGLACYPFTTARGDLRTLKRALARFMPHVVHTFGFTPAALLMAGVPAAARRRVRWVLQTRGGSDVTPHQFDPTWQALFKDILPMARVVLCDNEENYAFFDRLGVAVRRCQDLPIVPGSGGVDADAFAPVAPWSRRNATILWNKAYESPWSKGLPVLEAIRDVLGKIPEAHCVCTAADAEIRSWVAAFPEDLRRRCSLHDRLPRAEVLRLMRTAKTVLSPSLVDGIPNTLYESMAAGCVPIFSPLSSITPHFIENKHILYARNLYCDEIRSALLKSLVDPGCEAIVKNNLSKVREMADKSVIAQKIRNLYLTLGQEPAGS